MIADMCLQWEKTPDAFHKLLSILESLKDPFHAISLLEDGKILTPAEFFVLANLAHLSSRALAIMAESSSWGKKDVLRAAGSAAVGGAGAGPDAGGRLAWPNRVVPPTLIQVEKRLLAGSHGQLAFYVADSYLPELGKVRQERKSKEKAWRGEMLKEAVLVEEVLGRRPGLKEEIPIRKTQAGMIEKARLMPELGEIRETLTHVHFRLKATREAVKLEREVNRLRQREAALEAEVLALLSAEMRPFAGDMARAATAMGELDFLLCKAELARRWRSVPAEIVRSGGPVLEVYGACHVLVKDQVEMRGGRFQPVSISLDSPVSVITGPNMGGKTVALATAGLCVSLAQWGFLVPCERMRFTLYDFVYFHPQVHERSGLSSFAAEILALKEPLARKDQRGLLLLDELGRGTNPEQGLALYAAVLAEFIHKAPAEAPDETQGEPPGEKVPATQRTVLATTHYHGLAALLDVSHWQVVGLKPSGIPNGNLSQPGNGNGRGIDWLYEHMDYSLRKVGPDTPTPQDAILVAKLLGLEDGIVKRAEKFFREWRNDGADTRH